MIQGFVDPILVNQFKEAVNNALTFRQEMMAGKSFDRRRDVDVECGFPKNAEITAERLQYLFERDPIMARAVEIWPKECFQVQPEAYESEDENTKSPFDQAIIEMNRNLGSEPGYYRDDEGSKIWEYIHRLDVECGIGHYGVALLGVDDGLELNQPLEFRASNIASRKLLYVRVFPESLAQIASRETDRRNPRFGQPTMYNITFDNLDDIAISGSGGMSTTGAVHWTRVVHVADNLMKGSEIIGAPRAKVILNNILSLQKLYGGSGEMYWKGAFPGLAISTHPQLGGDVMMNKQTTKEQIEQYMNGLQRYLLLMGLGATSLAPQVVDPTPQIDKQIEAICIKGGYPVPVFKGYEVGENAGSMNTEEWHARIKQRQQNHITPRVVCPFFNRLINIGVLPLPTSGYRVYWPDITSQSEKDRADIGSIKIATIANYLKSGIAQVLSAEDMLIKFVGMNETEARTAVAKAKQAIVADVNMRSVPGAVTAEQITQGSQNADVAV